MADRIKKFEKFPGITFKNYNGREVSPLIGDHPDYINAKIMLKKCRENWTQEDYNRLFSGRGIMGKFILENGAEVDQNEIDSKYCYCCKYSHLPKRDDAIKYKNSGAINNKIYNNVCNKCGYNDKFECSSIIQIVGE